MKNKLIAFLGVCAFIFICKVWAGVSGTESSSSGIVSDGDRTTGNATTTSNTEGTLIASSGSGLKTYVTSVQVFNSGSSDTIVALTDGPAGTVLAYLFAPAGGGSVVNYSTPIATSAATILKYTNHTASTTVHISAQGRKGP